MKQQILVKTLQFSSAISCCLLVACSNQHIPEAQRVRQAPVDEKTTGTIAAGISEQQVGELLQKNPEWKVRVVNSAHGLFEFHGPDTKELKNAINNPEVVIEKNVFVKMKLMSLDEPEGDVTPAPEEQEKHPIAQVLEKYQGVQVEGAAADFVNGCKLNFPLAPTIVVESDKGFDKTGASIFFDIDETLKLSAAKSTTKGEATSLSFMWTVTAPARTLLAPQVSFSDSAQFKSDSTGLHVYSVIAKDDQGYCHLDIKPFYVTANYAFQPENAYPDTLAEKLDPKMFWHVVLVGAREAWKVATGLGVVIGVIDSGVDYNHPALANNILVNSEEVPGNGLDDDNNGFVDDVAGYDFGQDDSSPFDDYGHGTHVAGIAASNLFGAARKAHILPVKFGAGIGFDVASVVGAIRYSVDQGAKVLNMSFGWDQDLEVVRQVMDYAEEKNVLVVAAAGNDTANNDTTPSFPCNYKNKNILSIAASDESDQLTFYSNYGKAVHLAAPGGTPLRPILSTYKKNPSNAQYAGLMGTSMASPLVAGVAAQVWNANPDLSAVEVREILIQSGKYSPALEGRISSAKVVDAEGAVAFARIKGAMTLATAAQ